MEEYRLAIEDLKKAYMLAPEDTTIQQLLTKIKLEINKMKQSSEKFKGIFAADKNGKEEKIENETTSKEETPKSDSTLKTNLPQKPSTSSQTPGPISNNSKTPTDTGGGNKSASQGNKEKQQNTAQQPKVDPNKQAAQGAANPKTNSNSKDKSKAEDMDEIGK